jgi:WD40 repeat protein
VLASVSGILTWPLVIVAALVVSSAFTNPNPATGMLASFLLTGLASVLPLTLGALAAAVAAGATLGAAGRASPLRTARLFGMSLAGVTATSLVIFQNSGLRSLASGRPSPCGQLFDAECRLEPGQAVRSDLSGGGPRAWRLTIPTDGAVRISLTTLATDYDLCFQRSADYLTRGQPLRCDGLVSENGGNQAEILDLSSVEGGDYWIYVTKGHTDVANGTSGFTLAVDAPSPLTPDGEPSLLPLSLPRPQQALGSGLAISPDGRLLAWATGDRTVRVAPIENLDATVVLNAGKTVRSVAFSPDGLTLASAGDRTVQLWRVSDGGLLATMTGHSGLVTSVAFTPDGQVLASGSEDNSVCLWRPSDGALVASLSHPKTRPFDGNEVDSLAVSPDGRLLAAGAGDGRVSLWRLSDRLEVGVLDPVAGVRSAASSTMNPRAVGAVAFSPDGATLAAGSNDGKIRLWRVADGTIQATLVGRQTRVGSVAFSPDGRFLAAGARDDQVAPSSADGTVRLWRLDDGAPLRTIVARSVHLVAFSPDGRLLATGGGAFRLWALGR